MPSKKVYQKNPLTGKFIVVGGVTFKKLLKQGIIDEEGNQTEQKQEVVDNNEDNIIGQIDPDLDLEYQRRLAEEDLDEKYNVEVGRGVNKGKLLKKEKSTFKTREPKEEDFNFLDDSEPDDEDNFKFNPEDSDYAEDDESDKELYDW